MQIHPQNILLELYQDDTEKYFLAQDHPDEPTFGAPLVGIAAADDPWFSRFKQIIGEFHWTPQDVFEIAAPAKQARSVLSWSIPVSEIARKTNRREKQYPSREWAFTRDTSTALLKRLASGLVAQLREMGYTAVAPEFLPEFNVDVRPKVGLASCWSQRHVAFVAGLGTFSLSGGLITAHGIAHRLCSVVTDMELTPTPRAYGDDPFAWCLKTAKGTCGACIQRCPAGSVGNSVAERNKDACRNQIRTVQKHAADYFGHDGSYGCGLCQTAVPCEYRNPMTT